MTRMRVADCRQKAILPRRGRIALSANERIAEFLNIAIQAKFAYVNKLKRKSFVCLVCLCQFVFAGDCWSKSFHNINQGEVCPFTEKDAANQRKKAYLSKDKPCILKKRLNGVFDQNAGLIIQRFIKYALLNDAHARRRL